MGCCLGNTHHASPSLKHTTIHIHVNTKLLAVKSLILMILYNFQRSTVITPCFRTLHIFGHTLSHQSSYFCVKYFDSQNFHLIVHLFVQLFIHSKCINFQCDNIKWFIRHHISIIFLILTQKFLMKRGETWWVSFAIGVKFHKTLTKDQNHEFIFLTQPFHTNNGLSLALKYDILIKAKTETVEKHPI